MSFRITKKENTNFSTPQEMYTDYKRRKINGPLDYQSDMIDLYMKKAYIQSDVALELPTGSGKTLIGLLIGEFRRRKNKEKVVYVCPNNQLVYQTVEKARDSYGIKVNGFTGKIKNYDPAAKADYNTAQAISITNYSSLFLNNSFFSDADIIIMDDAHSAEGFIVSSWSLEIKRSESKDLYLNLLETIKDKLEITQYNRMNSTQPMYEDLVWFDKLPNIKMIEKQQAICDIVDEYVKETDLRYPWANIKDHLHACNIFLSWNAIVIRPYIPPALTHPSMVNSKQRIYMSATLGESGELERITGVPNIFRLPMVRDWDKRGIGRRFFIFPNASFKSEFDGEILKKINGMVNRSLLLTQDDKTVRKVADFFRTNTSKEVFLSKDIEHSKEAFIKSENGIAILANRFDGIDLLDDECRLLIIANLPSATHLQEKFLTNRMAASVLFNERIKTRLVQAVGRCTRSHVDYAAVCIFGQELENSLVSPNKLVQFHPELQAEIEFGYEQSISHNSIDDFLKLLKLFYERKEAWEEAEEDIINRRDSIIERQEKNQKNSNFDKLLKSSKYEVKFQYALWKKDFEGALNEIEHILALLDGQELKGYKGFWNYIAGYVSYQIYLQGKESFLGVSKDYMKTASTSTNSITWFNQLVEKNSVKEETVNYYVSDVLEKIEQEILRDGIKSNKKFEERAKKILDNLNDQDGNKFEEGHKDLGDLMGYISGNAKGDTEPDPWWIINDKLCIVSEDKIYDSDDKLIPSRHVRQACGHYNWIKEKVNILGPDVVIETVVITNTRKIEDAARIQAKELWYLNREDLIIWARKGIEAIRKLRSSFREEGDLVWRTDAIDTLIELKVTPKDFLDLIKRTRLNDL